jgi:hypothetical protein
VVSLAFGVGGAGLCVARLGGAWLWRGPAGGVVPGCGRGERRVPVGWAWVAAARNSVQTPAVPGAGEGGVRMPNSFSQPISAHPLIERLYE